MDFPYKYLVIVSEDDNYSESEQIFKYVDGEDAIKKFNQTKEMNCKSALYRIGQHFGYN